MQRLFFLILLLSCVSSNATGHQGAGCDNAVVIADTNNPAKGIAIERAWLSDKYPGYLLQKQSLFVGEDGRRFDVMEIKTSDGELRSICFDITAFFAGGRYVSQVRRRLSAEELPPFLAALKSEELKTRRDAVYRLSYVMPNAAAAAQAALVSMFGDADADLRFAAIDAVSSTDASLTLAVLTKILGDKDQSVAALAAQRLENMGPLAISAEKELVLLASSSHTRTRLAAAQALLAAGSRRPEATVAFAAGLKDENVWVRQEAAYALQRFGDKAVEMVPALIAALADPRLMVVRDVCVALQKMTVPEARRAYDNERQRCEMLAKASMSDLAKDAMPAGPKLN